MLTKFKTALFSKKNDTTSLPISEVFIHFLVQFFILVLTVGAYISLLYFLQIAKLQHTLIILILLTVQLLHRWAANESYFMVALSCMISKIVVVLTIGMMTMAYTPENPIIIGENIFYIFQAIVFIKSILQMGIMYILLGLCIIDALLGFGLYCSKKESEVRTVSLIIQTIILVVFIVLMQVELHITF